MVRTAVDPPAVSARRGIGPSASRLPASHTISSAWATPSAEPAVRSAVLSRPSPSRPASARPSPASDSPMPTATTADQDHDRADRRVDARQRIPGGQGQDRGRAARDRADQAEDLGIAPSASRG